MTTPNPLTAELERDRTFFLNVGLTSVLALGPVLMILLATYVNDREAGALACVAIIAAVLSANVFTARRLHRTRILHGRFESA